MDIITICQALLRWGILALAGGAAIFLLIAAAYLIYKRVLHGKKTISRTQGICAVLLCCWLVMVLGLTSLSRGANYAGELNIDFFSGYISAWNNWSISELQLIIFNVLMFAPLGFLLPIFWKKAEKIWLTLSVSLGLTILVESLQLITGTGIFELDDLFHNSLGSLFGYFCIMAILTSIREKAIRFVPIAKALLIPCIVVVALGAVFLVYKQQPYGNMDILPGVKQDMLSIQLVTELSLSEQETTASVYKNKYAEDRSYIQNVRSCLAALENLTFSDTTRREEEDYVYTGINANGDEFQLNFFFRSGQWSYTTYAQDAALLTGETAQQYRSRYETWLQENNLLPENAVFSIQNENTLRWDIAPQNNVAHKAEPFQNGSVMIQFDENGAIIDFFYQISWNEYVATEDIISAKEAYAQVARGNFKQYVPFQVGDILYIKECKLAYVYDTKGFYRPVYQFSGYINNAGNPWVCAIKAS